MVISFSSEKPRARLLEGKRVYTARKRRRKQFEGVRWGKGLNDWANEGRTKPKIADVIIFECFGYPITAKVIANYTAWSGFDSTPEWVEEIKRLNGWTDVRATDKLWLYMVQERASFFKPDSSVEDGANE